MIQSSKPITTHHSNTVIETHSFIANKPLQVNSKAILNAIIYISLAISNQLTQLSRLWNQANQSTVTPKEVPYPLNDFRCNPISDACIAPNFH